MKICGAWKLCMGVTIMLFSEIYGSYFNVVAAVLAEAANGTLTANRMTAIVQEKAFAESTLSIPAALKSENWPLLDSDLKSALQHKPTMPLTALQKRWLKALLDDPRIALFDPDTTGLEDVEPLYQRDTFVFFDQYADGDPYGDPVYIANFRTVLKAIREKRKLRIRFHGHTRCQTFLRVCTVSSGVLRQGRQVQTAGNRKTPTQHHQYGEGALLRAFG